MGRKKPGRKGKESVRRRQNGLPGSGIKRKIRADVIARDRKPDGKIVCHWCGRELQDDDPDKPKYATLDHLHKFADGGRWVTSNLVLACKPCNGGRHRGDGPGARHGTDAT